MGPTTASNVPIRPAQRTSSDESGAYRVQSETRPLHPVLRRQHIMQPRANFFITSASTTFLLSRNYPLGPGPHYKTRPIYADFVSKMALYARSSHTKGGPRTTMLKKDEDILSSSETDPPRDYTFTGKGKKAIPSNLDRSKYADPNIYTTVLAVAGGVTPTLTLSDEFQCLSPTYSSTISTTSTSLLAHVHPVLYTHHFLKNYVNA